MRGTPSVARALTLLIVTTMLVGCGSAKSPTGPTAARVQGPAPADGIPGATIEGTIVGTTGSPTNGMTITVTGTNVASPVDGSGHFALRGVPAGDIQLQIGANGVEAVLAIAGVSADEHIQLSLRLNGSAVDIDKHDRKAPDNRVKIEGRLIAIDAAAQTVTVANTVVSVPAGTPIRRGDSSVQLADLKIGDRVEIHGVTSGAMVIAAEIEDETTTGSTEADDDHGKPGDDQEDDDDHDKDDEHGEVEVKGTLSGRGGTCPAITFSVRSRTVVTNAGTEFRKTACVALADGDRVKVKGTRQANGSVLASRVKTDK
jgi:hypothetical protein